MQTEASAGIPAQLAGLPALTLDEGQLGDLELLLTGAFAPLRGYLTPAEVRSVSAHGTLPLETVPDGTPWPVPVTLDVPAGNLKPDKANAKDKIDPVVAAIMALGRAELGGGSTPYTATRGLLTL